MVVHCTALIVQHGCTLYSFDCTAWLYIVQFWLYSMVVHCAALIVQHGCTLYNFDCTAWLYTVQLWLYSMVVHCTALIVQHGCTLYSFDCTAWLYTVQLAGCLLEQCSLCSTKTIKETLININPPCPLKHCHNIVYIGTKAFRIFNYSNRYLLKT